MKRVAAAFLFCLAPFTALADSIFTKEFNVRDTELSVASFPDYFPVSEINLQVYARYETIFNDSLEHFFTGKPYQIKFLAEPDYPQAVSMVRQGKAQILLGAYFDTHLYEGLEFIYPAVFNNPVHLIMLPKNIQTVTSSADLKNFKGIYNASEYFSDYMLKNFSKFTVEPVKTADEAFKKLMTGEADYMFGAYYYNYAELVKRGLKNQIVFSNKPLWNMPLFIATTKSSNNAKGLAALMKKYVSASNLKSQIEDNLKNKIKDLEIKYQGTVPPTYAKQSSEITPADEQQPFKEE